MKMLLLSTALLAVVAISTGNVSARHDVNTHNGTQSIDSVAFRPESAVQGYIGGGKKVIIDGFGRETVVGCSPYGNPTC
ncbi:MAG: hypothetical protein JSR85_07440 [Proteobacteria bacterium]|nr:hypothetical protein [Pseudomonadota bacterium]